MHNIMDHGEWLSALAPIADPENGEVIAVLGIDSPPSFWRQEVDKHIFYAACVSICILLALISIYNMVNKNQTIRSLSRTMNDRELIFRTVFEQAPIGIAIGRNYKLISNINSVFEDTLGRTKDELTAIYWTEFTHPDDLQKDLENFNRFKHGKIRGYSMEKRFVKPDGSSVWVSMTIAPLQFNDESGFREDHLCLIEDITEQKKAQNALRESERSKAVLLSHLPGMAYRCRYTPDLTMQFVSDGCFFLTGYHSQSLLNNKEVSYKKLIAPEYRDIIWREWQCVLVQKIPFRYEYEILPANGNRKWVLELGQGIYDQAGNVEALEGIVIDITEQKKREAQIKYMGDHDLLTGFYNRRYFEEVKKSLDTEDNLPISMVIVDINGIRLINDALGYSEGDNVIMQTGNIIQSCCNERVILARTGGNEFSILMPSTDNSKALYLVREIKRACEIYNKTNKISTYDISLTVGYSTKSNKSVNISDMAKDAEDNLHHRKLLERKSSHSALLSSVMATIYERSQETEVHAERLAVLSRMIGEKLGLSQKSLNELELFSMLHDIGKVGIDDRILNKPGKLNKEEWVVMKKHPEIGYRIAMSSPELETIAEYILTHQERWDGNGYPQGLKEEEIPLLSRILSVVDAYDAMTQDRVYRTALSKKKAIEEIRKNAGTQFDPTISQIFIDVYDSIVE
ncbi:MAG: HD domain-containing phosphohydrolase [Christensenellales bacterium]